MKRFKKLNIWQKIGIILIMLGLGILGAKLTQSKPAQVVKTDLMVHDYVFENAVDLCLEHGGLHYIVPIATPVKFKKSPYSTCEDVYKIRCQDQYLIELNTGASACYGVSKIQWDETIAEDAKLKYHL